ncbi:four helix bundle protein [Oceanobacillus picturae]|uniref:four helix bundle protein n=1 Tax=Oceanobacillus picturae TaxID=171693 RepID=UPI00364441DE
MIKVDNFRNFDLYNCSLSLTKEILQLIKNKKLNISEKEIMQLRRATIAIPWKIASGISQLNIKLRFKRLNAAKESLNCVDKLVRNIKACNQLSQRTFNIIEELYKLFNGYFRWLSTSKQNME